ncbi:uncharacterized protein LOC120191807 isoform X3 [Hibiscus syriacus]|uniref:uncharacterized protein LOC120191807 isoform X3 n=1 Tax=Hibiscus syriacus TaxID=106335 RepID=UPI001924C8B8|nr:uncharacterized protein LOC120191807 isoform X3 [Hibiscus syriacus]
MAAPFYSTPFQPYVYQSQQDAVIPFQILGGEAQIVQIMLKPQEKVIAKPGSMCFTSGSIEMENTYVPENEVSMWQWFFGKSITSIALRNPGPNDGFVGIAAPSLARILPIDLAMFGGQLLCQPDAFLCSVNDVKVSNTVDQWPRNAVTGLEGFLRQKLSGQGLAFIIAGGSGHIRACISFIFPCSFFSDVFVLPFPPRKLCRKILRPARYWQLMSHALQPLLLPSMFKSNTMVQ